MRTSTTPLLAGPGQVALGLTVLGLAACRTAPPDPAPIRTPAPASMPAAPQGLPLEPAGAAEDDLVYDHRGTFGPLMMEQLAVRLDGAHATCARAPRAGDLQLAELLLAPQEVAELKAARDALLAAPPRPARRAALVHDLGVMTLTARRGGEQLSFVVDGAQTLEPYPDDLLRQLVALKGRCPLTATAQPVHGPSSSPVGPASPGGE